MTSTPWKNLVSGNDLDETSAVRKKSKISVSIELHKVSEYTGNGYEEESRNSKKAKMVYVKKQFEQFEDQVWLTLYKLKFTFMNSGSDFGIPVSDDPDLSPKQIDVFASDGNIALVIECKSAECPDGVRKGHDFKPNLIEISKNKEYQTNAIRNYFNNPDMEVGFVLFTNKYDVSDANKRIANSAGISVLNEFDLQYYNTLYKILGEYAKYQILSDIFRDKKINSIGCNVPAVRGIVSGHIIYSFLIEPSKILPLAYVAHRKVNETKFDQTYQRMINARKLNEIKEFIVNRGFFANSVIVNIDSEEEPVFDCLTAEGETGCGILHLPGHYKSMWVIDGQHRLFSFAGLKEASSTTIPVTAFYNLDKETQSRIFVDINHKQKKVDSNLLISIESQSKLQSNKPSEWADALNVVTFSEMSEDPNSVFYRKIKDNFKSDSNGDITIYSLLTAMRKAKLIGSGGSNKTFIPGPLYSDSKQDPVEATREKVKKFMEKTFKIFDECCPEKWNCSKDDGGYLATNNGMTAILYTISEALQIANMGKDMTQMSAERLEKTIERYIKALAISFNDLTDDDIKVFKNRQGAQGQELSHKEMLVMIHKTYDEFNNSKITNYLKESDLQFTKIVKDDIDVMEKQIINHLKRVLLKNYEHEWYKEPEFNQIGKQLNDIRFENGNISDPLENFINIDIAYNIIEAGKQRKFKSFEFKPDGTTYKEKISWITLFKNLRNKINSNEKIMKNEATKYLSVCEVLRAHFLTDEEDLDDENISTLN